MPLQRGIHILTTNPCDGRLTLTLIALTNTPTPFVPQRPGGECR